MPKKAFIRNLTDQEDWKPWDPGNEKGAWGWASDNAWDDFRQMSPERCADLLDDLIQASFSKRDQARLPEAAVERLCEELRENGHEKLESVNQAIMDPLQWTWEVAYWPEDLDIEKSIDRAREDFWEEIRLGEHWQGILKETPTGPKDWTPRGVLTEKKLFDDLAKRVKYRRKRNDYDRFLVFNWLDSPIVIAAKAAIAFRPDAPRAADVDQEIEDWTDNFMRSTFNHLKARMDGIDINTRYDFAPHWKSVLSDKKRMAGVRRNILEFLDL